LLWVTLLSVDCDSDECYSAVMILMNILYLF
jgi:hypothetical protein